MLKHTYILPSLFLLLRIFFCSILNIFFFCSPFAWSWKKELLISFLHMYFTEKKTAIFPFPSPLLSFFPVVLWCVLGFFFAAVSSSWGCHSFLFFYSKGIVHLCQKKKEDWVIGLFDSIGFFSFDFFHKTQKKEVKYNATFFQYFLLYFFPSFGSAAISLHGQQMGSSNEETQCLRVLLRSKELKAPVEYSGMQVWVCCWAIGVCVCEKNTSQCPVMTMTGGSRYSLCSAPYTYIYTRTPLWLLCYCADVACAGRRGPIPLSIPNKLKLFTSPPSPLPSTCPLPSPPTPPSSFSSICQSPIDPILLCRRHRGWVLMLARPRYMVDYPSS